MTDNFFEERKEQSEIKAKIVEKYFDAWSKVMISTLESNEKRYPKHGTNNPIAYIDLFSGPGKYDDGSESTPILILKKAIADPEKLQQRLLTIFNDKDKENYVNLCQNIKSIPNINRLKHQPKFTNFEVGDSIADYFKEIKFPPTLMFLDPFGYKGLSLKLISSIVNEGN